MNVLKHLLAFILLGSMLYLAEHAVIGATSNNSPQVIYIRERDLEQFSANYLRQSGHPPSAEEIEQAFNKQVDTEILVNEAIKLGIHKEDPVVRQRIIMNFQFLEQDFDKDALFEHAAALEMVKHDLVIRRRLLERMEKIIASQFISEPTDETLQAHMQQHADIYAYDTRYQLLHAFFSKTEFSESSVLALHQQWADHKSDDQTILSKATRSYIDADRPISARNLSRLLGSPIMQDIVALKENEILPPRTTETGFHLIKLIKINDRSFPDFAYARPRVKQDYLKAQLQEAISRTVREMRTHYKIERSG